MEDVTKTLLKPTELTDNYFSNITYIRTDIAFVLLPAKSTGAIKSTVITNFAAHYEYGKSYHIWLQIDWHKTCLQYHMVIWRLP